MTQELTKPMTAIAPAGLVDRWEKVRSLQMFNERDALASLQYDDKYPSKPAPVSLEEVADNRHRVLSLRQIEMYRGQVIVSLVIECITSVIEKYVHVKRLMDETMVAETARLICREYPQMSPSDVKLFMTKGVMNQYGEIFDRVDGNIVLGWAGQYWEQMKHLIRLRQKNTEKDDPKIPVPECIAELSEKLRANVVKKDTSAVMDRQRMRTLQEEYEARGMDLSQEIENREGILRETYTHLES